jgi:hypothetical protein
VEGSFTPDGQPDRVSQSGVYVLAERDGLLRRIGAVEGLGKTERIYAVRFLGPVGYVVTFRQTDPLYTVDLSDPARPAVRGELKIPGYSAYLHPVGDGRLIGIGQDATGDGRITGLQVSLFDVKNLDRPDRIATYTLSGSHSEAEFDPHAFLYWPRDGLLVVPLQTPGGFGDPARTGGIRPGDGTVGALALRVTGAAIAEVGFLQHPAATDKYASAQIRRSLIVGDALWTLSDQGLMANDSLTLSRRGWVPLG